MDKHNIFSQEELDNLGIDDSVSLSDDIRNIMIMLKNEFIQIENNVDDYTRRTKKKIRTRLNNVLKKLIDVVR